MFSDLYSQAQEFLQNNQFASGGLALALFGYAMYTLRKLPETLYRWIKSTFITELEITDNSWVYQWVIYWVSSNGLQKLPRRASANAQGSMLNFSSKNGMAVDLDDYNSKDEKPKVRDNRPSIVLSPAPGWHVIKYEGKWVLLHRNRKESQEGATIGYREELTLWFFTLDRSFSKKFLLNCRDYTLPYEDNKISLYRSANFGEWIYNGRIEARSLDSVILPGNTKQALIEDIDRFLNSKQEYKNLGFPYNRSYLLSGSPGGGKSSLIQAVAGHYGFDLKILNLKSKGLNDNTLMELFNDTDTNSILVLEDGDAIFDNSRGISTKNEDEDEDKPNGNVDTKDDSGISFSGLLNAMCGIAVSEGRIMFMTTNHPEKLDPALIRPGRIDVHFEVGRPNKAQTASYLHRFANIKGYDIKWVDIQRILDDIEFSDKFSMSALQGFVQENIFTPENVFDEQKFQNFMDNLDS